MSNHEQRVTKMEKHPQAKNDEIISFQVGHSGLEVKLSNAELDKILKRELSIQNTENRNIDEKLLHNLIFQ